MNYTKDERIEIGRRIYTHEITIGDAANKYGINWYTQETICVNIGIQMSFRICLTVKMH